MVLCLFVEKRVSVDSSVLIQGSRCKGHACVYSLTFGVDVLQPVDDDRVGGEVGTRMGGSIGERDEVKTENACRQCVPSIV